MRAAPTYHDEEVHEEQEQDARSYVGDDMADMHLYDDDDFVSRLVVLREEQLSTEYRRQSTEGHPTMVD